MIINREALAEEAVELVRPSIEALFEGRAKRKHLHIVVLDPTVKPWEVGRECRYDSVEFLAEVILYEYSFGSPADWLHPYRTIAMSKAYQAWRSGRANIITHMLGAASLQEGDTVYWGSFVYYEVVVAASGIQPWFDMLVSAWVATTFQQLIQDELQKFKTEHPNEDFLE